MGNRTSKSNDLGEGTWELVDEDIPIWSTEMWTPNLTVLMSSDLKHVVVRYRTNGSEIIEIKARGINQKIARDLIEFGKSLHSFSTAQNRFSKNIVPVFTLFMDDNEGSGDNSGFVEVRLSHQMNVEDEENEKVWKKIHQEDTFVDQPVESRYTSFKNIPELPSFYFPQDGVVCEEVIAKKFAPPRQQVPLDQLSALEDLQSTNTLLQRRFVGKEADSLNQSNLLSKKQTPQRLKAVDGEKRAATYAVKGYKTTRASHTHTKTKLALAYGLTTSDIIRAKKVGDESAISKSFAKDESKRAETNKKIGCNRTNKGNGNSESLDNDNEYVEAETEGNALDTLEEGACEGSSDSDSSLTPSTEVEVSDSETTLPRFASKITAEAEVKAKQTPEETEKASFAKNVMQRPKRSSLPSHRTLDEKRKKDTISGKTKSDKVDLRKEAFVRTLKHHDQDKCSKTTLSDFSDYDEECKLPLSYPSDHDA